jgi:hypothetical protein
MPRSSSLWGYLIFMGIEKRYYNDDSNLGESTLKCFQSDKITARFVMESGQEILIVDLNADELKEFICDLNFILKDINYANELH